MNFNYDSYQDQTTQKPSRINIAFHGGRHLDAITKNKSLKQTEKSVLHCLASYQDFTSDFQSWRFISIETMADDISCGRTLIKKTIKTLELNEYIIRRTRSKDKQQLPSDYKITNKIFDEFMKLKLIEKKANGVIEVGSDATEVGSNTTEVGSNTTEVGSNTTEVGSNTTEVGSNTTEGRSPDDRGLVARRPRDPSEYPSEYPSLYPSEYSRAGALKFSNSESDFLEVEKSDDLKKLRVTNPVAQQAKHLAQTNVFEPSRIRLELSEYETTQAKLRIAERREKARIAITGKGEVKNGTPKAEAGITVTDNMRQEMKGYEIKNIHSVSFGFGRKAKRA